MATTLNFRNEVGHQPWFFVPDTGTPGASAVLTEPDGFSAEATETQLSPTGRWGPRVGFKVPTPFEVVGEHTLTVTQDGEVTHIYVIDVVAEGAS